MSLPKSRAGLLALVKAGGEAVPSQPAYTPEQRAASPCVRLGEPTGETRQCQTCKGSVSLKVLACAKHGDCTPQTATDGVACCVTCPDYLPPAVVIDQGGNGIGDGLLGLLATTGFKAENPDVRVAYNVGPSAVEWVQLFHGYDTLAIHARDHNVQPTMGAFQLNRGWNHEWDTKFRDSSMWGRYCKNAGVRTHRLPELREPERLRRMGDGYANAVALAPFSYSPSREWPLERWHALERQIVADGFRTVIVTGRDQIADGFQGERAFGLSAEAVAAIFLNVRLIVANDSGPAHFGGILGRPVLAVVGDYPGERLYGAYPDVTPVQVGGPLADVPTDRVVNAVREKLDALRSREMSDLLARVTDKLRPYESATLGTVNRCDTVGWLLRELPVRFPSGPRVVETGCVREKDDYGAGYFGWWIGAYLSIARKGILTSVDIDPTHCKTARELLAKCRRVSVVESCSVAYLERRTEPVDVAYLDSLDTYAAGHADHGLREAQRVAPLMSDRSIIMFDDSPVDGAGGWLGKGRFAIPWLVANGWTVLPVSGYQAVLERSGN